jgi:hypothetical protein
MQNALLCGGCLVLCLAGSASPQAAATKGVPSSPAPASPGNGASPAAHASAALAPFTARYVAEWRNITVGTSELELKPDTDPGHYLYKWTITARGIFRLVYSNDLTQQSWLRVIDDHVRPERYLADQGESSVSLDFDWDAGHARGLSETKPVDLKLKPGAQDLMSIQVEVMLDLQNGNLPALINIVDKDELKEFIYRNEGTERIKTALGPLDTVIVSSRRANNNRLLRMWFAPALGYVPVQAERTRDGKLEFAMRIKTLQR